MKSVLVIDVDDEYLGKEISLIKFTDGNAIYCSEELKPMPTKKKPLFDPNHCEIEEEIKIVHEIVGYNRCIDEIMGETE